MQFTLVDHVPVTPSKCVFCGSVEGPFVVSHEETWIEGYGLIAVCAENSEDRAGCLVQAARLAGCVDEPVYAKVSRQLEYWRKVANEQGERLKVWEKLSDAAAKITGNAPGRREQPE